EDSKLASTITSTQVANLPLNGRNIYDLMLLSPGAINNGAGGDQGKTSEAGPTTIVNGTRQNFNEFLINGVSNKDLSGGPNNIPIEDSIQEFQQLTLNMSAQYRSEERRVGKEGRSRRRIAQATKKSNRQTPV